MNKKRREQLTTASSYLHDALRIVERARDEEQDCLDNMPENLANSERYESMENAIDALDNAIDNIEEAQMSIQEITGSR